MSEKNAATPAAGGGEVNGLIAHIHRTNSNTVECYFSGNWLPAEARFLNQKDVDRLPLNKSIPFYTNPQPSALPDEVVKDAERYRWLRDKAQGVDWHEIGTMPADRPEAIDAAIDAAMLKEGK